MRRQASESVLLRHGECPSEPRGRRSRLATVAGAGSPAPAPAGEPVAQSL